MRASSKVAWAIGDAVSKRKQTKSKYKQRAARPFYTSCQELSLCIREEKELESFCLKEKYLDKCIKYKKNVHWLKVSELCMYLQIGKNLPQEHIVNWNAIKKFFKHLL